VNMVAQKFDERHPVIQHTEIAPARNERTVYPTTIPGPYQPAARPAPRSGGERPAPSRSDYSAPKARQPVAAAPAAPAVTRQVEEAKAPTRSVPSSEVAHAAAPSRTTHQAVDDSKPSSRGLTGYRAGAASPTYSLRTSEVAQNETRPASFQESNPHVYYPKSYRQAAATHALPPANSLPATPLYSPDKSSSPRSRKSD
jgi:hypothetical protein